MSAPKTDIEKQKRRHFTPLVGLALAVAFGAGMFLLYTFDAFQGAEGPTDSESELQETSPPASEDAGAVDVNPDSQPGAAQSDATGSETEPETE